jgi:glycosyltransferase involved in cell wall biosynthesis
VTQAGCRVHLHTMLPRTGGAARVALLIGQGLSQRGWEVGNSSELPEHGQGQDGRKCRLPGVAEGAILHLHSSSDWASLLEALPRRLGLFVTLHDCSLLTGGCVSPMGCPSWREGCPGICARGYPSTEERCLRIRAELQRLEPVLVSPSRWLGTMARAILPGLSTRIVPNGVPWPEERPGSRSAARKRLGIHPGAVVVLFAAHGGKEALIKGGAHWERIWARIKARLPGAVGLFVGGRESARRGDLLLLPFVDPQMMDLVVDSSDLLVYPTLADNHPLVILEAMSRGVCVAAFDVGGISEQIRHGRTGLLVPAGDWKGLADCSVELLRSTEGVRIGREARDFGRTRFAVERMVRDYERIYRTNVRDMNKEEEQAT